MSVKRGSLHPKYTYTIEMMLLNSKWQMPYYGEFNTFINFIEKKNDPRIKTAGVNVTPKGMNHYYNPDFIDSLTQKQVNFLNLHETFHLLLSHPKRTRMGGFDHELSNIAQDMIINTILVESISPDIIDIPKDNLGRNTALFTPKSYPEDKEMVFEIMYDWLKERKEDWEKRREKKEDDKVFGLLHTKKNRPGSGEVQKLHNGQFAVFNNTLLEKSEQESKDYMSNFVRRVIVSLNNQLPVELYGHTSSVIPDGEDADYNQILSERRAELFKNAIIDSLEGYVDIYAYCNTIVEDEKASISRDKKLEYILKYEEISNETIKKQRLAELAEAGDGQADQVDTMFETYRLTELYKNDESTLKSIIAKKSLKVPNVAQEKLRYVSLAQNLLITKGFGSSQLIIENDTEDDEKSVLSKDAAKVKQYQSFINLIDSEAKQDINRRVEYKFDESFNNNSGGGSSPDSENNDNGDGYGQNGKNGEECYDLDNIFDNMENNGGEFMDQHLDDDVPEEVREQMVKDAHERLKARGFMDGNVEQVIQRLRKRKKDYLKEIKRGISQIKGSIKDKTIKRPSRRGFVGIKGNKKIGSKINVILDTSGSMGGYFEKALSFIFRNDIEINLIMVDTRVHSCENITNKKQLEKVVIKGLGGTVLQPGVEYVKDNFKNFNTLILTDGYTDELDFSGYNKKVLVISNGSKCPIVNARTVKQILVED